VYIFTRMLTLYRIARRHPVYFLAFTSFIMIASITICLDNKIDCFIKLNPLHERWLDVLFIGLTWLGDGLFSLVMAALVLLFWSDYRLTIHIVIAYLLSGLVAQLMKKIWAAPRPRSIIEPGLYKNFLTGISGVGHDSFPSGHTTTAFALATVLALHASNKKWGVLFLCLAVLVGYSRIYLGQHFLPDVTMGALLGTVTALFVYGFININLRKRTAGEANVVAGN
jgi:membrane-associated phospholipid phosphatase